MQKIMIMLVTAGIGSLGFGIIFKIQKRHLAFAFAGGVLTCMVLLMSQKVFAGNPLFSNLCAALSGGIYASQCARLRKAPVNVFVVPSLIPLVPGYNLYYSMWCFMMHENDLFLSNMLETVEIGIGIAAGLVGAGVIDYAIRKVRHAALPAKEHSD